MTATSRRGAMLESMASAARLINEAVVGDLSVGPRVSTPGAPVCVSDARAERSVSSATRSAPCKAISNVDIGYGGSRLQERQ